MKNDNKTTPAHLKQNAYLYIRQSTEHQIRENIKSQQQRDKLTIHPGHLLNEEATVVIDDGLSRSKIQQKNETIFVQILIKYLTSSLERGKKYEK